MPATVIVANATRSSSRASTTSTRASTPATPAPDYKAIWLQQAKPGTTAAGLHFSNLPYYLDADVKLAQSNAILRYLGRKHGLYGAAGAEHVVDVVLDQATDLDNAITGPCYRDFAALKPFFLDIYETLRKLALIEKAQGTAVLARYASLAAFVARVDVDLGTYRASPAFLERPLNNPHAQFR
ncbi:glutathione transferase [Aureococcus anophagefferens]|nr:glutathione transferase [Aureococcus anophagefferens]